jgi:arginyl-tRNA synthetase
MVTPATKLEFGDYQCNAAMVLAKNLGMSPRDCASKIVEGLRPLIGSIMDEPEIAGPGFINLKFKKEYLAQSIQLMASDTDHLAVPRAGIQQKIIVDYSSPNIAKEMHVGHLRSTIIGDTLSNVLEFSGHNVLRLNHVGDWGTQFGMLVEHLRDEYPAALSKETSQDVDLGDLVMLYKAAKKRFDVDDDFKVRAREGVVKLQAGDAEALAAWDSLCAASRVEYQKIYDLLNIKGLNERGESFYNPYLNGVIDALEERGLAAVSEGATVVFLDGYTNRDGTPLPMLVKKTDGGFNYATTDLAAIRHRTELADGEKADRVLYVTDAGQAQHFDMVFATAKKAKFLPEDVSLEHVPFGLVQGEDGKKFATRSGDTVKLKDLLDEAIRIAGEDIRSRREDPTSELPEEVQQVVKTVGIGAVKYADLSMNRESNYKFSYDRMLSLNGNTAPYMLYAYARICGIVRKASGHDNADGNTQMQWPAPAEILISDESEALLIRKLIKLPDILSEVENELYPNKICDYLFETSQLFNKFYESCSVNNAETEELKASRLSLCTVTAGVIKLLMGLLGINVVERL